MEAYNFFPITEILVVDNNSGDDTQELISEYIDKIPVRYIIEENVGLSYARNRGAKESKGDWLFYIDDDGKLERHSLEVLSNTIKNYDFVFITGIYKPWYLNPKPKWMPNNIGTYNIKGIHEVRTLGSDHISGGIMCINKKVLSDFGGFPNHLGMVGNKISYGEETYVQEKLREKGMSLGFNPFMVLHHLVPEYKQSVSWILKAEFARWRDKYHIQEYSITSLPRKLLSLLIRPVHFFFTSFFKFLTSKDYYWQNMLLDWWLPVFKQAGKVFSIIKYGILKSGRN